MLRYLNKFKAYYSFIPSISSNFKTSNSETFNYTSLVKIKLTKNCKKNAVFDLFQMFSTYFLQNHNHQSTPLQ